MDTNERILMLEHLCEVAYSVMMGDIKLDEEDSHIQDDWLSDYSALSHVIGQCTCGETFAVNFRGGKPYDYCPGCGWESVRGGCVASANDLGQVF